MSMIIIYVSRYSERSGYKVDQYLKTLLYLFINRVINAITGNCTDRSNIKLSKMPHMRDPSARSAAMRVRCGE